MTMASTMAARTWGLVTSAAEMQRLLPPSLRCEFRELQRVSDNIVIVDRRTIDAHQQRNHGPIQVMRTIYVLLKSPVDDEGGFTVAMKTVDAPSLEHFLEEGEVWCDVFYWFYFAPYTGSHGEPTGDTSVEFGGLLSYVNESIARWWLAELVFLAVRWETIAVRSSLLPGINTVDDKSNTSKNTST